MGRDSNTHVSLRTMAMTGPAAVPSGHWWLLDPLGGGVQAARIWDLSSGTGVKIGLLDTGLNTSHLDFRPGATMVPLGTGTPTGTHGTQVAGLIIGRTDNTIAGMGVAPDATLSPVTFAFNLPMTFDAVAQALASQTDVDISNNSWGFSRAFQDNFRDHDAQPLADAISAATAEGRGGLGTVLVFAGGNDRLTIDGVNRGGDSNFHNLTNARQTIAVGATDAAGAPAFFSSPGTNLLISAPGIGLVSADGLEAGADGMRHVSGTSFSAPLVSGTVALMLEVNPGLGYRDVQEILALTARAPAAAGGPAGAGFFNGGALRHDRDLGFGLLDAEAAVRLARAWDHVQTADTEAHVTASFGHDFAPDLMMHEMQVSVAAPETPFHLQWVELTLSLFSTDLGDLRIELVSPSGTSSVIAPNLAPARDRRGLDFTFTTAASWGEQVEGEWTLRLSHPDPAERFYIFEASADFHGDARMQDTHVLTPTYTDLLAQQPGRGQLEDGSALTLAAMDRAAHVDLEAGTGRIGAAEFRFDSTIHRVQASDHGDHLTGSGGDDHLIGGLGNDVIHGGAGGNDTIHGTAGQNLIRGGAGDSVIYGGRDRDVIAGNAGQDLLRGGAGDDRIFGGAGRDTIAGNSGDDQIFGGTDDDRIFGGAGDDTIDGGPGADQLWGGAGADIFVWRSASDSAPSRGVDRIMDFTRGQDRLDLSDFDLTREGQSSTGFSGQTGEWHHIGAGPGLSRLEIDINGDRNADFALELWNTSQLTADDLLF